MSAGFGFKVNSGKIRGEGAVRSFLYPLQDQIQIIEVVLHNLHHRLKKEGKV